MRTKLCLFLIIFFVFYNLFCSISQNKSGNIRYLLLWCVTYGLKMRTPSRNWIHSVHTWIQDSHASQHSFAVTILSHLENDYDVSAYSEGGRLLPCAHLVWYPTALKKEYRDWHIKEASCNVYLWPRSVTSESLSGWDKVYALTA